MKLLRANNPSRCPLCGGPIRRGGEILLVEHEAAHLVCVAGVLAAMEDGRPALGTGELAERLKIPRDRFLGLALKHGLKPINLCASPVGKDGPLFLLWPPRMPRDLRAEAKDLAALGRRAKRAS